MNQVKSTNKTKAGNRLQSELSSLINRGYHFGKKIGNGSYGAVRHAQFTDPETGETKDLACKYVDSKQAPEDFLKKFFPRELEILTKVSHPNIVRVHSILQSGQTVFIFMSLAENGDLLEYIMKKGAIPENQAGLWFFQMVSAIRYLHSLGYAHRDLKCENILISGHRNIKIADFGFARKCTGENNETTLSRTYCGSASYAAPEVIKGIPYDAMKSDIWSLGIILFIMLNSIMPFSDVNMLKLARDQKERRYAMREEIVGKLSDDCKLLVDELLEPNAEKRIGIEQVYESKWLRKLVKKSSR